MTVPIILGLIVALAGSGGVIFGALRYNREDAGKIVAQQAQILGDMRLLNDELQEALTRTRIERDELRSEVARLSFEVNRLTRYVQDHLDRVGEKEKVGEFDYAGQQ